MSSSSSTFKHKNGFSLTREEVAQLVNRNPQSLNSLPIMSAISLNLSIASPQNTKEEKNKLYLSLYTSISLYLSLYYSFIVILLSINKKAFS